MWVIQLFPVFYLVFGWTAAALVAGVCLLVVERREVRTAREVSRTDDHSDMLLRAA